MRHSSPRRSSAPSNEIVDRIYEAAVVPEMWPDLLARVSDLTSSAFGSVFALTGEELRFVGTPEASKLIGEFVALGKPELNTRIARGESLLENGFFTDHDIFSPEELEVEPFYRDFLRPRGYGWVAGTSFRLPQTSLLTCSFERRYDRGPFERATVDLLNELRPHLGRAALLSARLSFERAKAMANALEQVRLPAAVLRRGGRLYTANPLFEKLMPDVAQDRMDRLHLTASGADELMATAIGQLSRSAAQSASASIPIAANGDSPPLILHLLPVRRAAHDIFSEALGLLVITPVDRRAVPKAEVLSGLFDLTPAESRVARGIGEGKTIGEIARRLDVTTATVRNHLKSVFSKTGVHRQTELGILLAGTGIPEGPRQSD